VVIACWSGEDIFWGGVSGFGSWLGVGVSCVLLYEVKLLGELSSVSDESFDDLMLVRLDTLKVVTSYYIEYDSLLHCIQYISTTSLYLSILLPSKFGSLTRLMRCDLRQ
jgi:hypothetical protein